VADDVDKQIDRIYAGSPDEFVERRNELARQLRKEGDREGADAVKALRKPTVSAWTVNQLARREKMRLRALLEAGERLRNAHEELLGGGSPEVLQQARDDERRAIAELAGAARSLLEEAGHPANEPTLDRVRATLHAAAVDGGIGRRVREGRLDKEQQVTGFGFGTLPAAPGKRVTEGKRRTRAKVAASPKPDQLRRAKQEEAAREKRRRAEGRLSDARRALKEAELAARKQARELERAEAELERRRADLGRAQREVERARDSLQS
jgi:hypothetical protein